jgi:hypothetical protein
VKDAWYVISWFWAAWHLGLIALLIVGGPLARRLPRLWIIHLPALLATAVVNLAGADCPLTTWQKAALIRAGRQPYSGGFIEHYLVDPIRTGGMTTGVQVIILATWLLPTAWGYSSVIRRRKSRP